MMRKDLNNPVRILLAHQCTFGEKVSRVSISQFIEIKMFIEYEYKSIWLQFRENGGFSSL